MPGTNVWYALRPALTLLGLVLLAACTGSSEATPTAAAPSATASPEITSTPGATSSPPRPTPTPVTPVSVEGEYAIDDFELLVLSLPFDNRFPDHRAPDRLDRVYRDVDGEVVVEVLLTAEDLGVTAFRHGVITDPSGQVIVVAVCERGNCGGFGPPDDGALTVLHRSNDGGRTWSRYGEIEGGVWLRGWSDGEVILREATLADGSENSSDEVDRRYPSDRPLIAPPGSPLGSTARIEPTTGVLLWPSTDGGYLDEAGNALRDVPFSGANASFSTLPLTSGEFFWTWTHGSGRDTRLAALFDEQNVQLTRILEVPYYCCGPAIDTGRILVQTVRPLPEWVDAYRDELPLTQSDDPYWRPVPGVLDTRTGNIEAITDPFLRAPYQDRDEIRILAVVPGNSHLAFDPPPTGIPEVDTVVQAVMDRDIDTLVSLVRYVTETCRSTDQPGYDLSCESLGLPNGSSYEGVTAGGCDLGLVPRDGVRELLAGQLDRDLALRGIYVPAVHGSGDTPDHVVLVGRVPSTSNPSYVALQLTAGRITAVTGSCGDQLPIDRDVDRWIVSPADLGFSYDRPFGDGQ